MPDVARDVHSYARPNEARVTHVALDLRADFAAKTLSGSSTLTLSRAPGAEQIVLDTSELTIQSVTDKSGRALQFSLGDNNAILGRPLSVQLPPGVTEIVVTYRTSPSAAALQWLNREQTAGKQHPYLYRRGKRSSRAPGSPRRIVLASGRLTRRASSYPSLCAP